jgi:hypothetical protein
MLEMGLKTLLSLPCLQLGKLLIVAALVEAAEQSFSIGSMAFSYFIGYRDVHSDDPSDHYQSNWGSSEAPEQLGSTLHMDVEAERKAPRVSMFADRASAMFGSSLDWADI